MKISINYYDKSKEELLQIIANQSKQIQLLEETVLAYRLHQFTNTGS
jgi:hypothetical protein